MISALTPERSRVVVVGQGYVGLPLALKAAEAGHQVIGFDIDAHRVKQLVRGESHIADLPDQRLVTALDSGRYRPTIDTTELDGFDIALVAVPTPLRDGVPDLSYIKEAARTLGPHLDPGSIVVLESTSYPGTTEEVLGPLLEHDSGLVAGSDFHLGYSPERIDPGNAKWGLHNTPKLVAGVNPGALHAIASFYETFVDEVVSLQTCREAELAKLIENTFRHVNVALANELGILAHELGIDIWAALDGAATKPFGFMRFTPGPGVGGHCLPVDPTYLAWHAEKTLGRKFRLVELANDINSSMPGYVVERAADGLGRRGTELRGAKVLLLGLAYKANTGDTRESPGIQIAQLLHRAGAILQAADPYLVDTRIPLGDGVGDVQVVPPTPAIIAAADAVVVVADHDTFDFEEVAEHAKYVLDCRHRLTGANVETL